MGFFFCHCCLEGQRKLRVIIQGEDRFTFKKDADRRIAFGKVTDDTKARKTSDHNGRRPKEYKKVRKSFFTSGFS